MKQNLGIYLQRKKDKGFVSMGDPVDNPDSIEPPLLSERRVFVSQVSPVIGLPELVRISLRERRSPYTLPFYSRCNTLQKVRNTALGNCWQDRGSQLWEHVSISESTLEEKHAAWYSPFSPRQEILTTKNNQKLSSRALISYSLITSKKLKNAMYSSPQV